MQYHTIELNCKTSPLADPIVAEITTAWDLRYCFVTTLCQLTTTRLSDLVFTNSVNMLDMSDALYTTAFKKKHPTTEIHKNDISITFVHSGVKHCQKTSET